MINKTKAKAGMVKISVLNEMLLAFVDIVIWKH
jgi:hypothetical protein